jgi:choline dehydrogenase
MVYVTPFSKGSVTLNDDKTPCIDLGLLDDERDLECLEKGLLLSMRLADDAEYKTSCIKRWILHPGDNEDKNKVREYIKEHVDTLHHYAGTCKVGITLFRKDSRISIDCIALILDGSQRRYIGCR